MDTCLSHFNYGWCIVGKVLLFINGSKLNVTLLSLFYLLTVYMCNVMNGLLLAANFLYFFSVLHDTPQPKSPTLRLNDAVAPHGVIVICAGLMSNLMAKTIKFILMGCRRGLPVMLLQSLLC
ncbi:hypothetical protein A4A49_02397 [Nicotiana attenuata]|uniref:Uncharacterized protein n=1 Tax=Nicotiana attenuata TaxID=49451 RepID=A0A314L276_NICAT|nr:hypothetical protein A4A49_02397 [Nicotiana attenuata]